MNINAFLDKIKQEIGLGKYLITERTDKDLVDIIQNISIPVFSRYMKNVIILPNVVLKRIDAASGLYEIPIADNIKRSLTQHGVEFKGLKSITKNERANGSGFLGNFAVSPTLPFYNGGFTDARITNAFEYASRAESSFLGYKNEFVPPYSIRFLDVVINYENLPFNLYMFTTHANNLSTIDSNTGEAFATLVKYDIRRILWNEEFKFLNGLETTSATVNLQIDDWAQAEDKREEYLKELEDTRISSMPMTIAI